MYHDTDVGILSAIYNLPLHDEWQRSTPAVMHPGYYWFYSLTFSAFILLTGRLHPFTSPTLSVYDNCYQVTNTPQHSI